MRAGGSRPLVVISIDGLLPEHLLHSAWLGGIARAGLRSAQVAPVFPTLTFTNHASLATGRSSDRHGITSNTRFDPEEVATWVEGEPREWELDSNRLAAPAIWDVATQRGLRCALLRWPTTVGASVRWNMPEVFPQKGETEASTWQLTRRVTTPELIGRAEDWAGFTPPEAHAELDALVARLACELLEQDRPPDLTMIHLIAVDHELHEHGRGAPEAWAALEAIEAALRPLHARLRALGGTMVICGDHGFRDIRRRFHPNALLAELGWIRARGDQVQDWRAIAHTGCGQAPIYLRAPADAVLARAVEQALRDRESLGYRVISRRELDELGAHPGACCAVEGVGPVSMGQGFEGPLMTEIGELRGEHGYLGEDMQTALSIQGPGIEARNLGPISILDIPATLAELLDVELKGDGRSVLAA